jgi:hypothetical protein
VEELERQLQQKYEEMKEIYQQERHHREESIIHPPDISTLHLPKSSTVNLSESTSRTS